MSDNTKDTAAKDQEQALVKMYMEMTGVNENCARGVYMLTCGNPEPQPEAEEPEKPEDKP